MLSSAKDVRVGERLYINKRDAFSTYSADLISFKLLPRTLSAQYLDYAATSSLLRWGSTLTAKGLEVHLFIGGRTEDDAQINISNLLRDCQNCVIQKENSGFRYPAILTEYSHEDTEVENYQRVTLTFVVIQQKDLEKLTFSASGKYFNYSNAASGAIITVNPSSNLSSATVCGITVKNLTANIPFVIDGINKKVTANGLNRYGDTDMTDFPSSSPGWNNVTVPAYVYVTIEYYPTYL